MRVFVLLLLVANALYFAWSNGHLRSAGFAPQSQSEPERMAQQVKPESVRLLTAAELKRVEDQVRADQAPRECLQAGPLNEAQSAALRPVLQSSLPEGSWTLANVAIPARWMVYMGKFANAQAMAKKRAELSALNVKAEPVGLAVLEPGLSLGLYSSKERAAEALAQLGAKGVRTARVVQERAESSAFQLKLPAVTETLKPKLADVKVALGATPLKTCD